MTNYQKPTLNRTPKLRERLFWDTDFSLLDYHNNKQAIIERVFEYGNMEEIIDVTLYYGDNEVKNALLKASYLMEKAVAMACNLYNLSPNQFKCSAKKQYHSTYMKLLNG